MRRTGASGLAVALLLASLATPAVAEEVNRIVLRVNDRIATLHDYEARRGERVRQLQQSEIPPEQRRELMADLGESVLREMYEELLLLSRADQLGVVASEEAVDAAFRDTVDSLGIQNEAELQAALASSGLSEKALRAQIRRGMVMQEVIGREIRPRVQLQEEEMRRYYRDNIDDFQAPERWSLEDAVVLESVGSPKMGEIAAEVRSRVLAGESLAEAARDFAELGQVTLIDLGWVGRGDLEPALEAVAFELAAGQVSEPIDARGGLHVVRVVDYEEVQAIPYPEAEQEIASRLQRNRFGNEMTTYLEELEEVSFVTAEPPQDAEGFRLDLGSEVLEDADELFEAASELAPAAQGAAGVVEETAAPDPEAAASESTVSEPPTDTLPEPAASDGGDDEAPAPVERQHDPDIPTDAPTRELPSDDGSPLSRRQRRGDSP